MSTKTYVTTLPPCDVHRAEKGEVVPAYADAFLPPMRTWANVCRPHFREFGCNLGTGKGQVLIVGTEPPRDRRREVAYALAQGDLEALEDAIGDGDFAEFL